jgi:hypothetical protein
MLAAVGSLTVQKTDPGTIIPDPSARADWGNSGINNKSPTMRGAHIPFTLILNSRNK